MRVPIKERVVISSGTNTAHLSTAVLDSNMQFKEFVPWQDAMTLQSRGSAYTVQSYLKMGEDGLTETLLIKTPSHVIPMPFIVALTKHVYDPYAAFILARSDKASKKAILTRDRYTCAYCGEKGNTLDHIFPKSRGGSNEWSNLITACLDCNGTKGDRTPEEAGMPLLFEPETYDGRRSTVQEEIHELLMQESGAVLA